MRTVSIVGLAALCSIQFASAAGAQTAQTIEARYAKRELRIPMRDGKQLFTVVYTPRDTSRSYPVMLNRTPYSVGPYGPAAYPRGLG